MQKALFIYSARIMSFQSKNDEKKCVKRSHLFFRLLLNKEWKKDDFFSRTFFGLFLYWKDIILD